ncbi:hypothetical protein HME9304_01388 [Flagellimonas maritima]|uniref:Outer membrane protein beta-barrel domain-containing protein n=1 Tax=Flagellimonas maritima TaxID=1383885 RepID=A0A2Z4LSR5_9FLAO|nr:hypothetical protein [Allomuricauda aurantiaca]AWX44388.1 hypothetical protein HME9304_01388 [Allomuricauda aurantiaca]
MQVSTAQDVNTKREFMGLGVHDGVTLGGLATAIVAFSVWISITCTITRRIFEGATTGFSNFLGKAETVAGIEIDNDDLQFIPLAASIRFRLLKNLCVGPDIGYAIPLNDGGDGGFYLSQRVSYVFNNGLILYAGYRSIALEDNLASVQFGLGFAF